MKHINLSSQVVLLAACLAAALSASAQQGPNGNQYAACANCGINVGGYVFGTIEDNSTNVQLYGFCSVGPNCNDGWAPNSPLLLGPDHNFYGTTARGGANAQGGSNCTSGCGTIYEISPVFPYPLTTLYTFCLQAGCPDGYWPYGGLIQGPGTNLYGTTYKGGAHGFGTVFEITTTSGRPTYPLTTLYSFSGASDGSYPTGNLTLDAQGNIHGTTTGGGANGVGTVFEISPNGTLILVTSLGGSNGSGGNGGLQGNKGTYYGTAAYGGKYQLGTIFKLSKTGKLSTVLSFNGTNGAIPYAGLALGTDGSFYGTTSQGGTAGGGTAFRVTPSGKLTTLQSFSSDETDGYGYDPTTGLFQDTNGDFYGITTQGGATGQGGSFVLSEGLAPFIETLPISGARGTRVTILGDNLDGATSVTFNGIEAAFDVVSSTEIDTTVPAGAKTGKVQVVTAAGTLSSNVSFQVLKH
jgi:uncharacterized repeat protein (TIGR03803 family)